MGKGAVAMSREGRGFLEESCERAVFKGDKALEFHFFVPKEFGQFKCDKTFTFFELTFAVAAEVVDEMACGRFGRDVEVFHVPNVVSAFDPEYVEEFLMDGIELLIHEFGVIFESDVIDVLFLFLG